MKTTGMTKDEVDELTIIWFTSYSVLQNRFIRNCGTRRSYWYNKEEIGDFVNDE
jgi:hypothetical protein